MLKFSSLNDNLSTRNSLKIKNHNTHLYMGSRLSSKKCDRNVFWLDFVDICTRTAASSSDVANLCDILPWIIIIIIKKVIIIWRNRNKNSIQHVNQSNMLHSKQPSSTAQTSVNNFGVQTQLLVNYYHQLKV